jgi:uncharacterized membrane protein YjgN (DUF898 family)
MKLKKQLKAIIIMKDFFSKDINIIIVSFFFVVFMLVLSNTLGQKWVTVIGVLLAIVVLVISPFMLIKSYRNHKANELNKDEK